MSETNQNNQNSKKSTKSRLGRGLGSLRGGVDSQSFSGNQEAATETKVEVKAPQQNKVISEPPKPVAQVKPAVSQEKIETKDETKGEAKAEANVAKTAVVSTEAVAPVIAKKDDPAPVKTESVSVGAVAPAAETSTPVSATPAPAPTPAATIPDTARIWTVPVERLTPNTQQPRQIFEDDALKELSASIREKGILQPITARRLNEREFEIIAGERRWRAAQMAGLKEVPVILKTVTEQDSLELAILENIQRADLNPMEEADAYEHLMKTYGLTQVQVADRLGKERSSIANSLRLLALPPEVKLMVGGGELSSGHAKVLLGLDSMADQIALAKEVIREKLSVRALEKKVAERKSASSGLGATAGARPAMGVDVSTKLVEALAVELQKLIGTRVVIDYANRRGKLSVYFHSDEQLTEIVERMRRGWAKQNATTNASSRV
jgi:ParB family chromosome partitioning protein